MRGQLPRAGRAIKRELGPLPPELNWSQDRVDKSEHSLPRFCLFTVQTLWIQTLTVYFILEFNALK